MSTSEIQSNRRRLLERIARLRYQTVKTSLDLAGLKLTFVRITDPDAVLDRVADEQDRLERKTGKRAPDEQLHLPYWAELWDSAAGIAQMLVRHADELKTSEVLDLGCGMGLAGTVAARLGMRVLFADLETPALLFAQLNSLPDADRVRTRRLNWRTDRLDEKFNLILGADILYERAQWEFLEPFWREHLAPGGQILLGEPGRQTGDLFPEWICAQGWLLEPLTEAVATRPQPIRIFRLTQK